MFILDLRHYIFHSWHLVTFYQPLHISLTFQFLVTTFLFFVYINLNFVCFTLCVSDIIQYLSLSGLFHLAEYLQGPFYHKRQDFLLFNGWIIFHCGWVPLMDTEKQKLLTLWALLQRNWSSWSWKQDEIPVMYHIDDVQNL